MGGVSVDPQSPPKKITNLIIQVNTKYECYNFTLITKKSNLQIRNLNVGAYTLRSKFIVVNYNEKDIKTFLFSINNLQ